MAPAMEASKSAVSLRMGGTAERRLIMSKPPVHTVPHEDGWANRREGASRVSKIFPTKAAAQEAGRETARREETEHLIHRKDGTIGERNSYGNDPYPPRG